MAMKRNLLIASLILLAGPLQAADAAGIPFDELVQRILDSALARV